MQSDNEGAVHSNNEEDQGEAHSEAEGEVHSDAEADGVIQSDGEVEASGMLSWVLRTINY